MKTCLTFAAALVALVAGAEPEKSNPFATPDESSVVMGTPPKGAESLVADPRYRAPSRSSPIRATGRGTMKSTSPKASTGGAARCWRA